MDLSGLRELPYWSSYSKPRLIIHVIISSKYFDLSISGIIGLNVITMALEFHMMPRVNQRRFLRSFPQRSTVSKYGPERTGQRGMGQRF